MPEGLWTKCPACSAVLYSTDLEKNLNVCPKCGDHQRIGARARLDALIDPEGRFNKGKLLRNSELLTHASGGLEPDLMYADLSNAYTPSFGLMGHESLIMQQSDIGAISDSIKDCLRCGKCKPVCATHVPRANLLYSPRNKILATSLGIPYCGANAGFEAARWLDDAPAVASMAMVPLVVSLLAEQLREPAFDAAEFAKLKKELASAVQQTLEDTDTQALIAFSRAVFPKSHPARRTRHAPGLQVRRLDGRATVGTTWTCEQKRSSSSPSPKTW